MRIKLLSALALSSLLAACTMDAERPTDVKHISNQDPQWQQHLAEIKKIQSYNAQGQLGYISKKERFSTRFDWQYQNPKNYVLKLSSNLSAQTLQIAMQPHGMTISDNKGRQRSAADARTLLREIVGMDLPLAQFATWLKGQPAERADYQVGENHLLASFSYPVNGQTWTADYTSYHNDKPQLPENILLKTQGQTLKIKVDSWQK